MHVHDKIQLAHTIDGQRKSSEIPLEEKCAPKAVLDSIQALCIIVLRLLVEVLAEGSHINRKRGVVLCGRR